MKVSKWLKVSAGIMILHGFAILALVFFAEHVTTEGISEGLLKTIFACVGIIEIMIAVGIFLSKKIAVYSAPVLSAFLLLVNLSNILSEEGIDAMEVLFAIFYGIVIWLSISCIKQNRDNK